MRHQAADRACRQKVASHAAENPVAQTAMPVGARHNQIRPFILGKADQLRGPRSLLPKHHARAAIDPMPSARNTLLGAATADGATAPSITRLPSTGTSKATVHLMLNLLEFYIHGRLSLALLFQEREPPKRG